MANGNEPMIAAITLALIGLPLGSFLNVVAYRLPRGQTPWSPSRSHCPSCNAAIRPRDNVPVISWLMLRGRCRDCGGSISWRYPTFEAITAGLFGAVGATRGFSAEVVPDLMLVVTLVIVTQTDLDLRIVPNKVLLPAFLAGAIAQSIVRPDDWLSWVVAPTAAFGALLLAALAYPAGMGMGDVKLAGVLGLYLGRAVAPGLLVAFLAGAVVGLAVMAYKGVAEGRKTAVPFVPFMALGAVIALFGGNEVVEWYLDTFARR